MPNGRSSRRRLRRRTFVAHGRGPRIGARSRRSSGGWTMAPSGARSRPSLADWHHAYLRFRRWAVRGVLDKIMAYVVAQGEPQLAFACIDGTVARAHQKAAGARPGKDLD